MSSNSVRSTKPPNVSVIMNCLNCSKYLNEAIDSVYSQTFQDWEIIFWDNASTDNSAKIAKSYDSKLRYFCSEKTVPLGQARNLAIEKAMGKYIAFLDCDDIWLPEKLEMQIKIFKENPDVMLVYSNSSVMDSEGNILRNALDPQKLVRGNIFNELLSRHNFIALLTVIINKEVLDEVGIFNNNYNIAEEYDLFLRIAYKHPIDYVEQPLGKYRVHNSNASFNRKIAIVEGFEIINNWLHNYPELKKEIGNKVKIKKIRLQAALYIYYLVKYAHFPKRLIKFY